MATRKSPAKKTANIPGVGKVGILKRKPAKKAAPKTAAEKLSAKRAKLIAKARSTRTTPAEKKRRALAAVARRALTAGKDPKKAVAAAKAKSGSGGKAALTAKKKEINDTYAKRIEAVRKTSNAKIGSARSPLVAKKIQQEMTTRMAELRRERDMVLKRAGIQIGMKTGTAKTAALKKLDTDAFKRKPAKKAAAKPAAKKAPAKKAGLTVTAKKKAISAKFKEKMDKVRASGKVKYAKAKSTAVRKEVHQATMLKIKELRSQRDVALKRAAATHGMKAPSRR